MQTCDGWQICMHGANGFAFSILDQVNGIILFQFSDHLINQSSFSKGKIKPYTPNWCCQVVNYRGGLMFMAYSYTFLVLLISLQIVSKRPWAKASNQNRKRHLFCSSSVTWKRGEQSRMGWH